MEVQAPRLAVLNARSRRALRSLARLRVPVAGWHLLLVLVAVAAAVVATRASGTSAAWLWNADMPKIDYPLAVFFHDALSRGKLPLWNDQLGLGFPLYAEGQIGAFYPLNWLIFQLPPLTALDLTRLLHLTLAGVGTGWLAVRMTGNRSGALLACVVAVLGGAIVTKLEWTNLVAAYGWMPWVLLPLARRPAPTRAGLLFAAIAWGIQALAGHPNTWMLTGVAAVVLMFATNPRPGTLLRIAGFGVVGVAIGAVQLFPTLVLTPLSVRSLGVTPDDAFTSSTTGFDPLGFAFANAFVKGGTTAWDYYSTWFPDGIFALLESAAYVGLPVLALAMVGAKGRRMRPWLAVALVLALIPIGAAFRPTALLGVPILNGLRSPVRAYLVVSLVLGLLAGAGIARLRFERRAWLFGSSIVALMIAWYVGTLVLAQNFHEVFNQLMRTFSTNPTEYGLEDYRKKAIAALTQLLPLLPELAIGAVALALLAIRRPRRLVTVTLAVVAAVPLIVFSPQPNPLRPETDFSWRNTPFDLALEYANAHRVVTLDRPGWYEGMPDQLATSGVPDLEMFSSLNLLASDNLLSRVRYEQDAAAVRQAIGVDVVVQFKKACEGTQIAAVGSAQATVCRTNALRPPYWIPATAIQGMSGAAHGIPLLGTTNPVEVTLDIPAVLASAKSATSSSWATDENSFIVDAPADGYVWVDRAWWPDWDTTVDGQPVNVMRALAGQLIAVPAGHHVINQSLVPHESILGLAGGILAVLLGIVWVWLGRRQDGPSWLRPAWVNKGWLELLPRPRKPGPDRPRLGGSGGGSSEADSASPRTP